MGTLFRSMLMVPVAVGAGAVALWLTHQWNSYFGLGGALVVGVAAAGVVWLIDQAEPEPEDEAA